MPSKQPYVFFDLSASPGAPRAPLPVPEEPGRSRCGAPVGESGESGELVVDDGSTCPLDGDYVIGRAPQSSEEVSTGRARPLAIDDETGGISRVHARIGLTGDGVELTDLGSRNGTQVLGPGESQWRRLKPHAPVALCAGSRIAIGRRRIELRNQSQDTQPPDNR